MFGQMVFLGNVRTDQSPGHIRTALSLTADSITIEDRSDLEPEGIAPRPEAHTEEYGQLRANKGS